MGLGLNYCRLRLVCMNVQLNGTLLYKAYNMYSLREQTVESSVLALINSPYFYFLKNCFINIVALTHSVLS